MKKLIYIVTLLTLVGTQGRLLADGQAVGESAPASGEQEKSVTPGQEPTQAPTAPVQQEPVRQEDVVAEMPESTTEKPMNQEPMPEQPNTEPAPILPPVEEPKTEQPQATPVEEPAMK